MVRYCCVTYCKTDERTDVNAYFAKFPGAIRKTQQRLVWVHNVNRKEMNKDSKWVQWLPRKHSVVCHRHFVDGKPTTANPFPTLNMGHNHIHRVVPRQPNAQVKRLQSFTKSKPRLQSARQAAIYVSKKALTTEEPDPNIQSHEDKTVPVLVSEGSQRSDDAPVTGALAEPARKTASIVNTGANEHLDVNTLSIGMEVDCEPDIAAEFPSHECTSEEFEPAARPHPPMESDVNDTVNNSMLPDTCTTKGWSCRPTACHSYAVQQETSGEEEEPMFLISEIIKDAEYDDKRNRLTTTTYSVAEQDSEPMENNDKESEVQVLRDTIEKLKQQVKQLNKRVHNVTRRFSYKKLIGNDEKTRQFTGFPSYQCFYTVYDELIRPKAEKLATNHKKKNRPWYKTKYRKKPGPCRALPLIDECLLVMMRLRMGSLGLDLADRFEIHETQVSRILKSWIPCLAKCLKKLVKKPSKEQWKEHMPASFYEYPNTRTIIDCTEVFIERPTTLLARQQTWSTYKSHNTAKVLVGITPQGGISFLSESWGGRASDKHIVKHSGFLDTLDPYEEIMADRGFDITAELAMKSCRLNIPPFTQGKSRLSTGEVRKHRNISTLRIHVERAIERIKNFRILQNVFPLHQIHHLDDVMMICSAVVNLWPPIVT